MLLPIPDNGEAPKYRACNTRLPTTASTALWVARPTGVCASTFVQPTAHKKVLSQSNGAFFIEAPPKVTVLYRWYVLTAPSNSKPRSHFLVCVRNATRFAPVCL